MSWVNDFVLVKLKIRLIASLAFVLLAFACVLASCAPIPPNQVIESSAEASMNLFKNKVSTTIEELSQQMDLSLLNQFDIDPISFADSLFDDFDYQIEDVSVSSNTATANISIRCKSYSSFLSDLNQRILSSETDPRYKDMNDKDFKGAYGDMIMQSIDHDRIVDAGTITLHYALNGDKWHLEDNLLDLMLAVILEN